MDFQLLQLSPQDLLATLSKMNRVAFTRTRQSSKTLMEFSRRCGKSIGVGIYCQLPIEEYPSLECSELSGYVFQNIKFSDTETDGPNHAHMRQLLEKRQWRGGCLELDTAISVDLLNKLKPKFLCCNLAHTAYTVPNSVQILHFSTPDVVDNWSTGFKGVQVMTIDSDDSTVISGTVSKAIKAWKVGHLPEIRVLETGAVCHGMTPGHREGYAEGLKRIASRFLPAEELKNVDIEFGEYGAKYMGMLTHRIQSEQGRAVLTLCLDDVLDTLRVYCQVHFDDYRWKVSFPPRLIRVEEYNMDSE